jgi:signal transduction histidine kinase
VKIKNQKSKLFINIEDKGKGFNFEEKGTFSYSLGLKTLEERSSILNAIFNIKSKKGIGTNLEFVIPINF